ncbi:Protein unc-13B [Manis javanica]|nr:Protein unc-13B [Manis javanica]
MANWKDSDSWRNGDSDGNFGPNLTTQKRDRNVQPNGNDTYMFAVKILPGIETEERKPKGRDFPQQQERLLLGLADACLLMTRQVRTAQPYRMVAFPRSHGLCFSPGIPIL